ncbi:hypothetical protein NA56DRAFT_755937 [Hyaloscypha hepaticicola]|uniref:Apple domain-containing protein n=1 Tax=Hyaloscypha hepaticicola TaxID=2082293 RepID=A0A2J6PGR1_9HELO|nr:hypothetical protein NA56DRAFT_755937 [Hyaloscypha hepaticicola]
MFLPLLALFLPALVRGNPIDLEPRAKCYADNCLVALRRSSSLASAFCSTYYTTTATSVTTTTIPALGATFPVKKREDNGPRVTIAPALLNRGKATSVNFATKCTETNNAPIALSSGCSCLLGSGASTTTTTITSTSTLPLPPACSSQNSYGLYPTSLVVESVGTLGASGLGFDVLPGGCCAYCLASPNCYIYFEELDYVSPEPGKVGCSIGILGGQPLEPLGDATCPIGLATLSAAGPASSTLYGVGPCATVVTA